MTEPKYLVCPYCGHRIRGDLDSSWTGYGMNEIKETVIKGFSCLNDQCEATWNRDGAPNKPPRIPFTNDVKKDENDV